MSVRDRQIVEEDALLMRHLTLESQREFLMRRGFSPSHPYISGEVPIHPELQGRLPFHHVPSRYSRISQFSVLSPQFLALRSREN